MSAALVRSVVTGRALTKAHRVCQTCGVLALHTDAGVPVGSHSTTLRHTAHAAVEAALCEGLVPVQGAELSWLGTLVEVSAVHAPQTRFVRHDELQSVALELTDHLARVVYPEHWVLGLATRARRRSEEHVRHILAAAPQALAGEPWWLAWARRYDGPLGGLDVEQALTVGLWSFDPSPVTLVLPQLAAPKQRVKAEGRRDVRVLEDALRRMGPRGRRREALEHELRVARVRARHGVSV